MILAKRITGQLNRVPSGQAGEIQTVAGDLRIEIKFSDYDRLGCLLNSLELEHSKGGLLALDPLRIEGQVTYLEERLKTIETEGKTGRTILRSAPPRINGNTTSFYEMILDPAEGLSMVRYKYDCQRRERTPVPSSLTRNILERLLADLIGLAREN